MHAYAEPLEVDTLPSGAPVRRNQRKGSQDVFGHPRGLFVLFLTEMWERFSFYGMRALLVLYMVGALHYDHRRAGQIYGLYLGLVYLTPVIGGYIADRFIGQRRAILWGGFIMAAGHFALAVPSEAFFYAALLLIIIGCGLFKPNISVIVGQLYPPDDSRRDAAFSIFYMGINLGAALSPLVCGWLAQRVGWHWGFAAAGVGMLVGQAVYMWGQKSLGDHGLRPGGVNEPEVQSDVPDAPHRTGSVSLRRGLAELTYVQWQRMIALCVLALFGNIVFWACTEQAGGSMTIFADASTRLHIPWLNWDMPSTWFLSANPFFIMLLAPLFSFAWVRLGRAKMEPSTPIKFVMGLLLLGLGFFTMAAAGKLADTGGPVSMGWLTLSYFFCTAGELCVSPVGLSVVTKLAPPRYVSLLMGLWFASMALGNWFAGLFTAEYDTMSKATFFALPAYAAVATGLALLIFVRPLRRMMHGVN